MKKDLEIMFCPKCSWKLINPDISEKTNKCPKCDCWTFEISQYYYYKGKKLIGKEFYLSDNDEISFTCDDYREAKRIIDKAFKVFAKAQNKESVEDGED